MQTDDGDVCDGIAVNNISVIVSFVFHQDTLIIRFHLLRFA